MSDFFLFVTVVVLVCMGLVGMLYKRNLIKVVIALNIFVSGINLFLVTLAYRPGSEAPIFTLASPVSELSMVLPTPHALILTNIVIGFATTALLLAFIVLVYRNNGTLDIRKLRGVHEDE